MQTLCNDNCHHSFDLLIFARDNREMKRERMTPQPDRQRFLSASSAALVRATAVRAALLTTVFGLTASAIAGERDKAPAATPAPIPTVAAAAAAAATTPARVSTVGKLRHWFQTGQASWYGLKFNGHKTATGETFNMNALTCAHRSLPLGSWIRVTNLSNSKAVLVRVTDRGPFASHRIVDLSYAAAQAVGLNGTGKVKLEQVNMADPVVTRDFLAQLSTPFFPELLPAQ